MKRVLKRLKNYRYNCYIQKNHEREMKYFLTAYEKSLLKTYKGKDKDEYNFILTQPFIVRKKLREKYIRR